MGTLIVNQYLFKLWTPAEMTTALWLDASKTESITLVNSAVSQWSDLSGNNKNATQSNSGNRPTYSAGEYLIFDGTTQYLETTYILPDIHAVFYVARRYTQLGSGSILRPVVEASIPDNLPLNASYGSRRPPLTEMEFAVGADRPDPLPTWNVNERVMSSAVLNQTVLTGGKNGLFDLSANASPNATTAPTWIGGGPTFPERRFAGEINEVIILSSVPTELNRQKIEGYLAHKWALSNELPVTHPYKNTPPYV
jgi:hypothetical protein